MNWDQVAGKWMQVRGSVREHWVLTDDDFERIAGIAISLSGSFRNADGIAKGKLEAG